MKISLAAACTMALVFAAFSSKTISATPITWSAPQNQSGYDSDVFLNGTLTGAATAGPTVTVNGVEFQGPTSPGVYGYGSANISTTGLTTQYTSAYSNPNPNYSNNYGILVGGGGYALTSAGASMTLSGLAAGDVYMVEIFEAFWNNNWATNFTDGNTSGNVNLTGPNQGAGSSNVPQYLLGYFTATGPTETIDLGSPTNYTIFDAAQVRDLGAAPEPSSLALLGTGILGAAGVIRRRLA